VGNTETVATLRDAAFGPLLRVRRVLSPQGEENPQPEPPMMFRT
jgi:hypothetical protein